LAALEAGRKKMSHKLQDEIAQTLLGIRLRLLSLRHQAQSDPGSLKNEIASTQRLVVKSAASLRRFAHKLDNHHVERGHRPPPTVR
jgi:signal transduction histidine kinase